MGADAGEADLSGSETVKIRVAEDLTSVIRTDLSRVTAVGRSLEAPYIANRSMQKLYVSLIPEPYMCKIDGSG